MTIGVLAIQGSFREHFVVLDKLKIKSKEVKLPKDLEQVDGLIIPGGESTTMSILMKEYGLDKAVTEKVKKGMIIYGTCAGMILLAKNISYGLRLINIEVDRNAYGRQLDSFETRLLDIDTKELNAKKIDAVFIRAPKIKKIGKNVKILAKNNREIVFAREKNILVSSFHPELTAEKAVYQYFVKMLKG